MTGGSLIKLFQRSFCRSRKFLAPIAEMVFERSTKLKKSFDLVESFGTWTASFGLDSRS